MSEEKLTALELAERELSDAGAALDAAQKLMEEAASRYAKAAVDLVHAQGGTENPPLHVLNAHQERITRVEDARRQKALNAFRQLEEAMGPITRPRPVQSVDPGPDAARDRLEG